MMTSIERWFIRIITILPFIFFGTPSSGQSFPISMFDCPGCEPPRFVIPTLLPLESASLLPEGPMLFDPLTRPDSFAVESSTILTSQDGVKYICCRKNRPNSKGYVRKTIVDSGTGTTSIASFSDIIEGAKVFSLEDIEIYRLIKNVQFAERSQSHHKLVFGPESVVDITKASEAFIVIVANQIILGERYDSVCCFTNLLKTEDGGIRVSEQDATYVGCPVFSVDGDNANWIGIVSSSNGGLLLRHEIASRIVQR